MFPEICGEHFHNGTVIDSRLPSDSLEAINPTETNIEIIASDLLNGTGESFRQLAGYLVQMLLLQ
jgi:hypothetical protein